MLTKKCLATAEVYMMKKKLSSFFTYRTLLGLVLLPSNLCFFPFSQPCVA